MFRKLNTKVYDQIHFIKYHIKVISILYIHTVFNTSYFIQRKLNYSFFIEPNPI